MKIIHINNVANVPATLKFGQETLGHTVELYQPSTGGSHRTKLARIILSVKRLKEMLFLIKRLRAGEFDVIHIHYGYYGLIGILAGKPYYLHCHGTDVRRNLYKFPYSFPTKIAIKKAKKIFYSTPDLKQHFQKIRKDAIFIPNPIRTDLFDRSKIDPLAVMQDNTLKLIILSRLEPIKGTDIAISATRSLSSELTHFDPMVEIQISAIDWGVDAKKYAKDPMLALIPKCSYEKMPALLAGCNIAVGQLFLGILSMAELEAMSMELPVLAYFKYEDAYTEKPPIVDVKPAESDAQPTEDNVVRCLRDLILLDQTARKQIGIISRDWVVRNHDAVIISKKVLSEYS